MTSVAACLPDLNQWILCRTATLKPGVFHCHQTSNTPTQCILDVNVNVYVYSLISHQVQQTSQLLVYTPGIGTLSCTVPSPLGRIQHIFCS